MHVYRLSRAKYAHELSGKGASLTNNRWNSKGTEIIYTASSRALAMAEILVHLRRDHIPHDFVMLQIFIPNDVPLLVIDPKTLPKDWISSPLHPRTQSIGDQFVVSNEYGLLKMPSAVVLGDWNYGINPHHSTFKQIRILDQRPFNFDLRLF